MEDVLEVYSRPYDERHPVVCMDEKPLQLLAHARKGYRKKNGTMIQDSEYVRNGTCSIFLFTEPLAGFRHAKALEHRTKIDWAKQMRWLADEIELSALSKQCLGKRRIDNLEDLNSELEKWHTDRNSKQKGVDWQFTTDDARVKLKHLYPIVTF